MHHPRQMSGLHPGEHPGHDGGPFADGQGAPPKELGQGGPFDQRQHQDRGALVFHHVQHGQDVRMVQAGLELAFGHEVARRRGPRLPEHELQGAANPQHQVAGGPDLGHASHAEQALHFVSVNLDAAREHALPNRADRYTPPMGILQTEAGTVVLAARHLVGRSRAMNTVISDPAISGQHAVIRWDGSAWVLRDLGSRNGTARNDDPAPSGDDVRLHPGDVITFGGKVTATFVSDGEPAPVAMCDGDIVEGDGDLLALPSPEDPQAIVTWDDAGRWMVLRGEQTEPTHDGAVIEVGGRRWTLSLPETLTGTQQATAEQSVDQLGVRFGVSADEEYVEVTVSVGGTTTALKPRAQHYLLLTLARQRISDDQAGMAEAEQGWVYSEQLEKMLRASSNQVYVTIHRLRKEFAQFAVLDTTEIIQRRATTRQVRIGTARLAVAPLDPDRE